MKKILYVILHTCKKPDRYDGIINSWGKNVDYIFYSDCEDKEKKIIKVSTNSTYSSNEEKHINIIKHLIDENYQYEWFFFCDDDTFVNTKKLEDNINIFDENKINGCVLNGTWGGDKSLSYCSGGAGYLIKKEVLYKISKSLLIKNSGYSDVTLGLCTRELGVEHNNLNGFNSQKPKFYNLKNKTIKDMYTYHYITPEIMIEMYNILNYDNIGT